MNGLTFILQREYRDASLYSVHLTLGGKVDSSAMMLLVPEKENRKFVQVKKCYFDFSRLVYSMWLSGGGVFRPYAVQYTGLELPLRPEDRTLYALSVTGTPISSTDYSRLCYLFSANRCKLVDVNLRLQGARRTDEPYFKLK